MNEFLASFAVRFERRGDVAWNSDHGNGNGFEVDSRQLHFDHQRRLTVLHVASSHGRNPLLPATAI